MEPCLVDLDLACCAISNSSMLHNVVVHKSSLDAALRVSMLYWTCEVEHGFAHLIMYTCSYNDM